MAPKFQTIRSKFKRMRKSTSERFAPTPNSDDEEALLPLPTSSSDLEILIHHPCSKCSQKWVIRLTSTQSDSLSEEWVHTGRITQPSGKDDVHGFWTEAEVEIFMFEGSEEKEIRDEKEENEKRGAVRRKQKGPMFVCKGCERNTILEICETNNGKFTGKRWSWE